MDPTPRRERKSAAWIVLGAIALMLCWSSANLFRYVELARDLHSLPAVARGGLGMDIWRNFLARAGVPPAQRAYDEARRLGVLERQRSSYSSEWIWIAENRDRLPPDARIYLNTPDLFVYYYANTLWFPRRVDVSRNAGVIRDDETLAQNLVVLTPSEYEQAVRDGFTDLIARGPRGLHLVDLRAASRAGPR